MLLVPRRAIFNGTMGLVPNLVLYILIFLSVYVQVFLLVTFLENKKKIVTRKENIKLGKYPAVTILVPAFNEERTIYRTVRSLLDLNYPQDKLKLFLVDDGSTDGTWNALQKFSRYPNVRLFKKENGGKYTALNLGLLKAETEFFGCLDADSYAHPEALVRIMSYFETSPEAMAVVPSVTVTEPKNIIQSAQKAEYHMGVYMKKMYDFLGAINVTPGPFTIFRKKVFDDLGPYRHAHNTEDMEIAYRMQTNNYLIVHCNDAYIYTNTPETVRKLFRQRLRWMYGFINNTLDYKGALLRRRYGNFALFALPTGVVSISAVSYMFGIIVYNFGNFIYAKLLHFQAVGLELAARSFDPFFVSAKASLFLLLVVYGGVFFAILFGRKMSEGKWRVSMDMLYFFVLFRLLAPFWILKAIWNTLRSRAPAWK